MGHVFGSLRLAVAMLAGAVLAGCAQSPGTLEQWGGYEPRIGRVGGSDRLSGEKTLFAEPTSYMDVLLSNAQGARP
ncbi:MULTISPECIES: hypothetical protein [Pseudomonas]|uniref:hypothetical protein n=1 Tax=Pseudomonas TaxID=286 RepID=UPI002361A146|nr:hypothetical protein [Pseudomonas asplenii]